MRKVCLQTKTALWLAVFWFISVALACGTSSASEKPILSSVLTTIQNHELIVNAELKPGRQMLNELREGVKKELIFYVDLFRVWKIWPDEFVAGKKYSRTISADPIKKEFICETIENNIKYIKRFKDFESMTAWAFNMNKFKLINTKELEPAQYFVKVTIESKIRRLPSLLKAIIIIPENEFSITMNSGSFSLPQ
ncbi:MAG: DUF4390 domain-containing protein [Nitrospirae bacterium]|nr:DUF4390 domain-containing protein [Nitrospirota bacterium]